MGVTVYRFDDAGAPTLSAAAGALISVLDACLVNGYGAKPAAGWTKAFSDTNRAAYRQGAGSTGCYLRVDATVARTNPLVRGYVTMSDINTGTYPFPTTVQSNAASMCVAQYVDVQAHPWLLAADSKRFYLWVGYNLTTASGLAGSTTYQQMHFFGDIESYKPGDQYHCTLVCSYGSSSSYCMFASVATPGTNLLDGHYTAGNAALTIMSAPIAKYIDVMGSGGIVVIGTNRPYPDAISGGLRLSRVFATNAGVAAQAGARGHFPGLWAPLHALPGNCGDTFSGTGVLAGRTFMLLDAAGGITRGRVALELSDTWD